MLDGKLLGKNWGIAHNIEFIIVIVNWAVIDNFDQIFVFYPSMV